MKRPIGFILLAVVMAWLAISGFANFWLLLTATEPFIPIYFAPFMLAYGIAAIATMVGLWTMRHWVLLALQAWMAICGLFLLTFGLFYNSVVLGGILGMFGLLIFICVLFALLYNYVEKAFEQAA